MLKNYPGHLWLWIFAMFPVAYFVHFSSVLFQNQNWRWFRNWPLNVDDSVFVCRCLENWFVAVWKTGLSLFGKLVWGMYEHSVYFCVHLNFCSIYSGVCHILTLRAVRILSETAPLTPSWMNKEVKPWSQPFFFILIEIICERIIIYLLSVYIVQRSNLIQVNLRLAVLYVCKCDQT